MAYDRLWLFCEGCKQRSPRLGKYWGGVTFVVKEDCLAAFEDWVGEHWLMCDGPRFRVVSEKDPESIEPS